MNYTFLDLMVKSTKEAFLEKVQPRDIIGITVIILCFIGKYFGINGKLDIIMALIIGYYFSKRVYEEKNR